MSAAAIDLARAALALNPTALQGLVDGGRLALAYLPHLDVSEQRHLASGHQIVRLWEAVARFRSEVDALADEAASDVKPIA